jgi:hypothetical protein
MTCTIHADSEDIELTNGEIVFVIESDDGRCTVISGQYFERFALPEILTQLAAQLPHCAIQIDKSVFV